MPKVKFIDLFAGIGGIRKGFETAFQKYGYETECVMTSEIKPHAYKVLQANHPDEEICGDITKINADTIPDFDFLLGGFPCQAFSYAGKRLGFQDTRGTLFFEVERILKEKKPFGFILENVEGLVTHDREDSKQPIGKTLTVILNNLEALGYQVSWRVLNSKEFGLAQERKRIYIVGTDKAKVPLDGFAGKYAVLADILEKGQPAIDTDFTRLLMSHFTPEQLYGKSIKDKRGGDDNIHSWDIEMKGPVSEEQKKLLNMMLRERRKKKWALMHGIKWMDGMPLTMEMIKEFYQGKDLKEMLEDLVEKGYLKKEHPKTLVVEHTIFGDRQVRRQDTRKKAGYNIVAGKLSFEINKILDPHGIAPTLVAMDMKKIFVVDNGGVRPLTLREGLRLFGYPDDFKFPVSPEEGFDLLGNTVAVPVIAAIAERLANVYTTNK
ncbi:DNA (cytosine-5-)-methyltransferase [Bacteroides heparinolyticus]|uniref:Cytosine-specific methyltransferase n=1 Tax=Prevotella heparinolytica TaxID=28113 RepID=A0A3P2A486_9BACE|nr:DNA (cytosine-5-)-methyltransferase [Bacteroides heparinolyticus]RRD90159.1 DNA (cytosine-5-)-methyltransferase [Bacteroides heparinolyticus]